MSNIELLTRQAVRTWLDSGVTLRPGATEEQIRDKELQLDAVLPSDFRHFLSRCDGLVSTEHNLIRIWSHSELVYMTTMKSLYRAALKEVGGFVAFADYSVDATTFGIAISGSHRGRIIETNGLGVETVVDSFEEFLLRILQGSDRRSI